MATRVTGQHAAVRGVFDHAFVALAERAGKLAALETAARQLIDEVLLAFATDEGERVAVEYFLDLRDPARRPLHERLENLAALMERESGTFGLKVYRTAQILPRIAPELSFKWKADEPVLGRPLLPLSEEQRDEAQQRLHALPFLRRDK